MEPLTRRAALVTAGLTATSLAGCGDTRPTPGTEAAADPDLRLVREAVRREEQLRAELRQAAQRYPGLRTGLQQALVGHRDHVEVLSRALGARTSTTVVDGGPRAEAHQVARQLARRERSLADAHAAAALDARSGPLARVLAGMAAAADQQARVLDRLGLEASRG